MLLLLSCLEIYNTSQNFFFLLEKFLKTFHKPFTLKVSQNFFIKTGAWAQPHALKIKREPVLNRLL